MKYAQGRSFSVPGSGGSASYCAEHGHTLPDSKGKCLRCSAKVRHAYLESLVVVGDHAAIIDNEADPSSDGLYT